MMKLRIELLLLAFSVSLGAVPARAQGTAFTYQGRLSVSGAPANGSYDLRAAIYTTNSGPGQIGPTVTNVGLTVADGLFSMTLDFGPGVFTGGARWLELAARTNGGGGFTVLSPRQQVLSAPYAMFSADADALDGLDATAFASAAHAHAAADLTSGTVSAARGGTGQDTSATPSGSILRTTAAGTWGTLAAGANGQVLKIVAGQPTWGTESSSGGTVTSLDTGLGLSGGPVTNIGVIAIDTNVVPRLGAANVFAGSNTFSGVVTLSNVNNTVAGTFSGNGAGLTSLNAANVTSGVLAEPRVDAVLARDSEVMALVLAGDGSGSGLDADLLDGLNATAFAASAHSHSASEITLGALSPARGGTGLDTSGTAAGAILRTTAPGTWSTLSPGLNGQVLKTIAGQPTWAADNNAGGTVTTLDTGLGLSGGPVTNSGIITIDTNVVPRLGSANVFAGSNTFNSVVTLTNVNNTIGGNFTGSGANLSSLNANNITLGTVSEARIAATIARDSEVLTLVLAGDGSGSSLDADLLDGLDSGGFWKSSGNSGTTPGTHFVGTTDNQPLEFKVNNLRALRLEDNGDGSDGNVVSDGAPNVIGGSPGNFVGAGVVGATISGGGATNYYDYFYPTNTVLADYATVGGGMGINAAAFAATVGGGAENKIGTNADYATVSGGDGNEIGTNASDSAIGGGHQNDIQSESRAATIAGGYSNDIGTNADYSAIGGGKSNDIQGDSTSATIAGGDLNTIETDGDYSAIGGGYQNAITYSTSSATIGGGYRNEIAGSDNTTIGGGSYNFINGTGSDGSTISGGTSNTIYSLTPATTIGGGRDNYVGSWSSDGAVGGGRGNRIGGFTDGNTVAGGQYNDIGSYTENCTVGGGVSNTIAGGSLLFGYKVSSTIGSGSQNAIEADYGTIPGGRRNEVTADYGFAAGRRARASHTGAFVWADSTDNAFASTASDQVSFRCNGGVRFTSGSSGTDQTVTWTPGSGSWSFTSDRNAKEDFTPVNGMDVLDKVSRLPLAEWSYKGFAQRHIGPMAQDFHAAFPFNESETTLNSADLDGVALAAIQGLNQKLEAENAALRGELRELREQVQALAVRLEGERK